MELAGGCDGGRGHPDGGIQGTRELEEKGRDRQLTMGKEGHSTVLDYE